MQEKDKIREIKGGGPVVESPAGASLEAVSCSEMLCPAGGTDPSRRWNEKGVSGGEGASNSAEAFVQLSKKPTGIVYVVAHKCHPKISR